MRITRFVHSCLLVEDGQKAVLVDPGYYSWTANIVDIAKLPELSAIVISHDHADHYSPDFVKALRERFSEVPLIVTESLQTKLAGDGIAGPIQTSGTADVEIFEAAHERLPAGLGEAPQNFGVHIFGKVTHPGDCHRITVTKEILALPITAPWGSVTAAVDVALAVKPKAIIPIHDWHWHSVARESMYDLLVQAFTAHGLTFVTPEDGTAVEL